MLNTFLNRAPALALMHLPAAFYSVQVVVPSLGESITDGTIAAVLKAAGDPVQENETIAQIETDKVTVDIKAPSDGTILGIVVQEQETVVPGQLVATLDDAAAKAKLVGGAPALDISQPTPAPAAAAAAPETPAAASPAGHRIPGIRFPPRILPDGRRISMLPAAESTAILQEWRAGMTVTATPAAAGGGATAPQQPAPPPKRDLAGSSFTAKPAAAAAPSVPSKFATSVKRLDHMPARRELTEKEMELIELGGAL